METVWLAVRSLAGRLGRRTGRLGRRAGLRGRLAETGALSLEWIVIAVLLVGAAGIAYAFFKGAIVAEARKLP